MQIWTRVGRFIDASLGYRLLAYFYNDSLHYEKFPDGTVKCIEDEIPFELPEGWEWCNLSMIGQTNIGLTYHPTDITSNGIMVLRSSNIVNGKLDLKDLVRVNTTIRDNQYVENNDILICARNGSKALVGKCTIIKNLSEKASFGAFMAIYRTQFYEYIYYFLNSNLFREIFFDSNSTTINQLTQAMIKSSRIPLPPLQEQKRIIAKLNKLFSFIDTIESNKTDLQSTIQLTKSKILDLAIRGKLIPQEPNDEPASVLLERIRAEKEELIKQGKIKRDKKESVIFRGEDNSYYEKIGDTVTCIDAELPHELPEGWAWVRLENCCQKEIKRGKSPKYVESSETLVFAQKCNTKYDGINMDLALFLDESTLLKYPDNEFMQDMDIVINSTGTGTLGRVGVYRESDNHRKLSVVADSHVTVIRTYKTLNAMYCYYFLKAHQHKLEKLGEGSTNQKELKPLTLKSLIVPIPPYTEQKRIVEHITTTFVILDSIEKSLS